MCIAASLIVGAIASPLAILAFIYFVLRWR